MAPSSPVIVCFGDSLTAGFQSPSPENPRALATPYGDALQERIAPRATVVTSGNCGELTGEMVLRFSTDVLRQSPTVVVILGGTNDLGWNADPAEILRNLVTLYERAAAAGVVPVPITVPSIRVEGLDGSPDAGAFLAHHLDRRRRLNRLILEYAQRKALPYFNLFDLTAEPNTDMLAPGYSNDGLHLSTAGYRRFGSALYERVFAPRLDEWFPMSPAS